MRLTMVLSGLAALVLAGGGLAVWTQQQSSRVPSGFAAANGRIEVDRVDIASKLPGRVAEIKVRDGDWVEKGAMVASLDTTELLAQLAAAKAAARKAEAGVGRANADVAIREAEHTLSEVEWRRAEELERRAVTATAEVDRRKAQHLVTEAQILGAKAAVRDAQASVEAAQAQVAQIEATLADMVLRSPVSGRVEYKLAQPGEVVASGARLATILDLTDVWMTVFLPTSHAGRVRLGSEARIVLDAAPSYVIPATVSFVAAEAQFTPKGVETANEREKLMYRVRLKIDPTLLETYRDYVKAGLTGSAYLSIDPAAPWPGYLTPRLPEAPDQVTSNARS
jgi:HlyD family secretion protein